MRVLRRPLTLACLLVLAGLVAVPLGADAASRYATPPPLALPNCASSQLRLDRIGGQGFTGHREWDFALRNVTSHACKLSGFPGIKLLDKNAKPFGVSVVHHGSTAGLVVLHTWQRVKFAFVYTDKGPCIPHFFTAYGLRVTPPGTTGGLVFYAGSFGVCSFGHPTVSAVHP